MRILLSFPKLGRNGDPLYWGPILKRIAESGIEVSVISFEKVDFSRHDVRINSMKVRRSIKLGQINIPDPFDLIRKIRNSNPDIVFVNEFSPLSFFILLFGLASPTKITRVLMVENHPRYLHRYGINRKDLLTNLIRSVYCFLSDVVLSNNKETKHYLKSIGCSDKKIVTKPYLTSSQTELSPKEKSSRGDLNIVVVAQLIERKGLLQLVNELSMLSSEERIRIRVDIFGEGSLRIKLDAMIKAADLSEVISLKGEVPRDLLLNKLNDYNLSVIPTLADYRSLAAFEAISLGLPIIISIYDGSVNEVLNDGRNGLSFNPSQSGSLYRCLSTYLKDPTLINKHSKASILISNEYTLECSFQAFMAAIRL